MFNNSVLFNDWRYFQYASDLLKNDVEFILSLIKERIHEKILLFVNERIVNDSSIMISLIKETPKAFEFASSTLKGDKKFIMACIENGVKILYLKESFQDDDDIALLAVKNNPLNYCYLSERLRGSRKIIQNLKIKADAFDSRFTQQSAADAIIPIINYIYLCIPKKQRNEEMLRILIYDQPFFMMIATPELKDDITVALPAIRKTGYVYKFLSDRLKESERNIKESLKTFDITKFIPEKLKEKKEIAKTAVSIYPYSIRNFPLFTDDYEVIYEGYKKNKGIINHVSLKVKDEYKKYGEKIFSNL